MWQFNFFGGLRASSPERSIERFRTQKTAALLALLALRGSRSREDACALLWPDASPEAARNSLSAALSALRRELGDDIVRADRTTVSLATSLYQTDVAQFNEALKADDLARAVELYRGHLLPGFHEDPFPAFEREYEEKARTAFKSRLEELEENGQSTALLELARRAVNLFGDDERWFLALMRGHYGLGDLDAALRVYDSLGRFMRKSGDTASESARVLAKLIRRDKEREAAATPISQTTARKPLETSVADVRERAIPPAVSSPPVVEEIEATRNNLPTQWTRFFGREAERSMLATWLRDGQKMVTLSGAGGSGKTRLALETLRELAPDWEGDIVYVPLAALSEPDLILPALRDALQLMGTPDLSPLEQIERALRGRRALVFLDNFEQLVEGGAARLQALRERLTQTTFLVTSRVLLQLPGEREFPVSPLPTPLRNTTPDQVRECASAALFCDRSGLVVDASNAEAMGALCRRLDGIPLALELAAARAKVLSPAQILERLQKHPDFLQSRELGVPARHKTLRATIEWSTDLLPPDLREFWTRLSLFHGGWTLDAAEKIASPGICEDWETLDWLTQLRECSLIFTEESGDSSRFRMLETLREFGREQLQRTAEVEHAFFDFYLGLAQQAASAMQGPGQTAWLGRLDAEQDNLRAALAYARDSEPERGLLLATALIDFWETRLSLDEGRSWIETFLRATATIVEKPPVPTTPAKSAPVASTSPSRLEARSPIERSSYVSPGAVGNGGGTEDLTAARVRALSGSGRLASHSIELAESRALVEEGLVVARQSGSASNLVYAIASFVRFAMTTGDVQVDMLRARALADEAVGLARGMGDKALLLEALAAHNYIHISLAEFEGLRAAFEEAIALARELKDDALLSRLTSGLAHLCYREKKWDEANALLDESTPMARRLTSPWELMEALWVRSHVAREQGRLDVARAAIAEEWEMCRGNHTLLWARSLNMMTIAYLRIREGDAVSAALLLGAEEALREKVKFQMAPVIRLDYERYRDEAQRILGDARFTELWREGWGLSDSDAVDIALYGDGRHDSSALTAERARALSAAGRMAWYASDLENAEKLLSQGLDAARRSGDTSTLIYATRTSALASTAFGGAENARALGRESVRLARELGNRELLLKALNDLGFAEINVGDFLAAESVCREAITLARKEGNERALALALGTTAIAYNYLHRYDEARALATESEGIARRIGAAMELMVGVALRGHVTSVLGNHEEARAAFREALTLARVAVAESWTLVNMLLSAAYSFARSGDARGCARIMGACASLAENIGYELMPFLVPDYEHFRGMVLSALGDAEFTHEWNEGRLLTSDGIIDFIIGAGEGTAQKGTYQNGDAALSTRSLALSAASRFAWHDSDFTASRTLVEQGLEAARKSGDTASYIHAVASFVRLATVSGVEFLRRAEALAHETVRLSREANDDALLIESLISVAYATMCMGQITGVGETLNEAIFLARKLGDDLQVATVQVSLATLAYHKHQYAEARELLEQCTATSRRLGSPFILYASLWCESLAAREMGDFESARRAVVESLEMCRDNPAFRWSLSNSLLSAGYLLVERNDVASGVRLLSAADALAERSGYELMVLLRIDFERYHTLARKLLDEPSFRAAWEQGRTHTFAEALSFAFERLNADPLLATRSRALSGAGRLAWHDSDFAASRPLVEQGLEAARESGDTPAFVRAVAAFVRLASVGGDIQGDMVRGRELAEEAVRLSRAQSDQSLLLEALVALSYAIIAPGEIVGGRGVIEESVSRARQLGDEAQLRATLVNLATLSYYEGKLAQAHEVLLECIELCRRTSASHFLFASLWCASNVAREQDDFERARATSIEALEMCRENEAFRWKVPNALQIAGYLLAHQGEVDSAAQLLGASISLGKQVNYQLVPLLRPEFEHYQALVRQSLGNAAFLRAYEVGQAKSFAGAMEFALERLTALKTPDPLLSTRARALSGAGRLAWYANDLQQASSLLEQGLNVARQIGDTEGIVYATRGLTRASVVQGDSPKASQLATEALSLARASGEPSLLIKALLDQAFAEVNAGNLDSVLALGTEAADLARQIGDESSLTLAFHFCAIVLAHTGRDEEALTLIRQSEEVARRIGSAWDVQIALANKGRSLSRLGQHAAAQDAFNECFALCRESSAESWTVSNTLFALANCFIRRGDVRDGAQLLGAAEAMRQNIGYPLMSIMLPDYEESVSRARQTLGEAEFAATMRRGATMTSDETFDFAIRSVPSDLEPTPNTDAGSASTEILAARARALSGAGRLAWYASDMEQATTLLEQGLDASRQIGDTEGIVYATRGLTRTAAATGDSLKSRDVAREALELARASGDLPLLIKALLDQAFADINVGELDAAALFSAEAITLSRQIGDETALSLALNIGAIALAYRNRDEEALGLIHQSEEVARRIGSVWDLLVVLALKGDSLSRLGEHRAAQQAFNDTLSLCRESFDQSWTVANSLLATAYSFIRRGEVRDGVQILGAAEAMRERIGYEWMPVMVPDYEKFVASARRTLGAAEFESVNRRGAAMTPSEAFDFAIRPLSDETQPVDELAAARSRALSGAGRFAWHGTDLEASRDLVYQGLQSARESGDLSSFVYAVAAFVRFAMLTGDVEGVMAQSRWLSEEAVERSRNANEKTLLLESLTSLAYAHIMVSRFKEAQATNEEAIALARELGDETRLVRSLNNQASVYFYQGRYEAARTLSEESVPRSRQLNSLWELTASLWTYATVLREQGELEVADRYLIESMELCRANPAFRWGVFNVMTTMSYLFVRRGAVRDAVRLMGAADVLRQSFGYHLVPVLQAEYERYKAETVTLLGQTVFDEAWEQGSLLSPEAAIELALHRDETTFPRLQSGADENLASRSRALSGAGRLAWHDSDLNSSQTLVNQGLDAARQSGDLASFVYAVAAFVRAAMVTEASEGLVDQAYILSAEAVERSRRAGDKALLLDSLISLGYASSVIVRLDEAFAANEEAIALSRELEDEANLSRSLTTQIGVYYQWNRPAPARILLDECIEIARRLGSDWDLVAVLWFFSGILRQQGHLVQSGEAIAEVLELCSANLTYRWRNAHVLMMASYLFVERGVMRDAVCIMAAAESISASVGYRPSPNLLPEYERYKVRAREVLGEPTFQQAWEEGWALTNEEAIGFALQQEQSTRHSTNATLRDESLAARSRALNGIARLTSQGGDLESSRALVEQGLAAARASGDTASFVYAVAAYVRFAMTTGDSQGIIANSRVLSAEAVARSRREKNKALLLDSLISFGYATCIVGRLNEARDAADEAIALGRELEDETNLTRSLNLLVNVYYHQGIYPPARIILEESGALARRLNSPAELIASLWGITSVAREQGEFDVADAAMIEILEICRANPSFRWGSSNILVTAAYLFIEHGQPIIAVRLMSAAAALSDSLGYRTIPILEADYERYSARAREALGEATFATIWEEGRILTPEAAIELALRLKEPAPQPQSSLSNEVLAARSRALSGAGRLAWHNNDLESSRRLVHEGLDSARASGDTASFVYAVAAFVRFAMTTGDIEGIMAQSRHLSEEAVARSRRAGDKALLLDSLISLGYSTSIVSQFRESYTANEEAIALARELGDETSLVRVLNNQGTVYYSQGMYAPARMVLAESESLCRRLNSTWDLIASRWTLSSVAREQGDLELAKEAIVEVLEIYRATPSVLWSGSNVLLTASYLLVRRDDAHSAVRLMAAAEELLQSLGYHLVPVLLVDYERYRAEARETLREAEFASTWEEGRTLSPESVIEFALNRLNSGG